MVAFVMPLSLSAVLALSYAHYSKPGILSLCLFSLAKLVTDSDGLQHAIAVSIGQGDVI